MENLPKEMLLKIIGDKKLEDLPNEVLVHIIADREKQMKLQQFLNYGSNMLWKPQTFQKFRN